jgi:hypothetical protein
MADPAVEVTDLVKRFGQVTALDGIDFRHRAGGPPPQLLRLAGQPLFSPARTSFVARLRGWTFDRDASSRALTVKVTEAGIVRARLITTVLRKDVNAAYHITGYHGYDITINAKPGPHRYCVTASNVGAGASTVTCVSMTVTADEVPIGHLDALSVINGLIVATGWAYDANDSSYSTDIKLASAEPPPAPGAAYAQATAGYPSPDVDAAYPITGKHRFSVTLPRFNDGTWTVCATAMDLAPTYPFNGLLGHLQATVHNDPFGQAQATVSSGNVHLGGYAVDPSDTSASLTVRVMLSPPATQYLDFPADLPSDAIDTVRHHREPRVLDRRPRSARRLLGIPRGEQHRPRVRQTDPRRRHHGSVLTHLASVRRHRGLTQRPSIPSCSSRLGGIQRCERSRSLCAR